MGAGEVLRSIQFYRKVHSDFTETSISTGVISILAAVTMTFLFFSQLSEYLKIKEEMTMVMDENTSEKLRIHFNITMQFLPCRFASVDVSDSHNEHYVNISTHISKWRIVSTDDGHERLSSEPTIEQRTEDRTDKPTPLPKPEVLNQYSDTEENSVEISPSNFEELVRSHDFSMINFYAPWCHWSNRLKPAWEHTAGFFKDNKRVLLGRCDCTKMENRALCQRNHIMAFPTIRIFRSGQIHSHEYYDGERETSAFMEFINTEVANLRGSVIPDENGNVEPPPAIHVDGHLFRNLGRENYEDTSRGPEGCLLSGYVLVNRAPGNFHIQAKSSEHSFNADNLNTTHVVNSLTFGVHLKSNEMGHLNKEMIRYIDTLENQYFVANTFGATREHYVKVVHTTYHRLGVSKPLSLYQYTSTDTEYVEHPPSAKFSFDLSPAQIVVKQTRQPFTTFLTSVCAIIGGVFTVIGLIDSVLYHSLAALTKQKLGKLG